MNIKILEDWKTQIPSRAQIPSIPSRAQKLLEKLENGYRNGYRNDSKNSSKGNFKVNSIKTSKSNQLFNPYEYCDRPRSLKERLNTMKSYRISDLEKILNKDMYDNVINILGLKDDSKLNIFNYDKSEFLGITGTSIFRATPVGNNGSVIYYPGAFNSSDGFKRISNKANSRSKYILVQNVNPYGLKSYYYIQTYKN